MGKYSIDVDLKGAYRIAIDNLRDIDRALARFSLTSPTITVRFTNGHELRTETIEDIVQDPLPRARRIKTIDIRTSSKEGFERDSVRMGVSTILPAVDIDISGNKDKCLP